MFRSSNSRLIFPFVFSILFLFITFQSAGAQGTIRGKSIITSVWQSASVEHVQGELLVGLEESANCSAVDNLLAQHNVTVISEFDSLGIGLVDVPPGSDLVQIANTLTSDSNILYAEPNMIMYFDALPNDPYFMGTGTAGFPHQWPLLNEGSSYEPYGADDADIDAEEGWILSTGSNNVEIAVLDTGIPLTWGENYDPYYFNLSHPDLNNVSRILYGGDYVDDSYDTDLTVRDRNGHGTHVTGIIAAETNNGEGIAGVCHNCRIRVYQVGLYAQLEAFAFERAMAAAVYSGTDIINLSLGSPDPSNTLYNAVKAACDKGILVVCSAGNDGRYGVDYPARFAYDVSGIFGSSVEPCECVISVAATNHEDRHTSYSSYTPGHNHITVAAPGGDQYSGITAQVFSTIPGYLNNGEQYGYMVGTSMAAPHVSGLAGLILSRYPDLSPLGVRSLMESTADDVNINEYPGVDEFIGSGRINAWRALTANMTHVEGDISGDPGSGEIFISGPANIPPGAVENWSGYKTIYLPGYLDKNNQPICFKIAGSLTVSAGTEFIALSENSCIEVTGYFEAQDVKFSVNDTNGNGVIDLSEVIEWEGIRVVGPDPGTDTAQANIFDCDIEYAHEIFVGTRGSIHMTDSRSIGGDYGIRVDDGLFKLEGNTISAELTGIDISRSHGINHHLLNNHISDCQDGVAIYNSIVELGSHNEATADKNTIENNSRIGIIGLNQSEIFLYANNIIDNGSEEIYFDHSCKLDMDHTWQTNEDEYNLIEDDDYQVGTPDEYLIYCRGHDPATDQVHQVRGNYWGTDYEENRFGPDIPSNGEYDSVEIFPLYIPSSRTAARELYIDAKTAADTEDYDTATILYQQIATDYPQSEEALASITDLYYVEKQSNQNFTGLRGFYESYPHRNIDPVMNKTVDHFIRHCLVRERNFPPVIESLEAIIANPPSVDDLVFATIDLGYVYLEMENSDAAGPLSVTGSMPELRPVNSEAQRITQKNLLAQLLSGEDIILPGSPDHVAGMKSSLLYQNYPNPFNPTTVISFQLPVACQIQLSVYNTSGQLVKTLASGIRESCFHKVVWDGKNESGLSVSSGIYFYRLTTNSGYNETRSMIFLK